MCFNLLILVRKTEAMLEIKAGRVLIANWLKGCSEGFKCKAEEMKGGQSSNCKTKNGYLRTRNLLLLLGQEPVFGGRWFRGAARIVGAPLPLATGNTQ